MKDNDVPEDCNEPVAAQSSRPSQSFAGLIRPDKLLEVVSAREPSVWKWYHKDGYREYEPSFCESLESFYQGGHAVLQWKGGKQGQRPMMVFFNSMLQYDVHTENTRQIQRFGPDTMVMRLRRTLNRWILVYETGKPQTETFDDYELRRDHLKERRKSSVTHDSSRAVMPRRTPATIRGKVNIFTVLVNTASFTYGSLLLVFCNVIWIIAATDLKSAKTLKESIDESIHGIQVVEILFCSFFCVDLLLRFLGLEQRRFWYTDAWFVFDLLLVTLMVLETWVFAFFDVAGGSRLGTFRALRILRLVQLTRVARVVRWMPQMMTLLNGVVAGLKKSALAFVLLFSVLYIFAIVFRSFQDLDPELQKFGKFNTVQNAAFTLLVHGIFLDEVAGFLDELSTISGFYFAMFLVFVVVENWTVLNILIGFQCEVAHNVSRNEQRHGAFLDLESSLMKILQCYDQDGHGFISRSEFDLILQDPDICDALAAFGTDAGDLASLRDLLFERGGSGRTKQARIWETEADDSCGGRLTFEEFLAVAARLRGTHASKVTDIVELREYMRQCISQLANDNKALADLVERSQVLARRPEPPPETPAPFGKSRRAASITGGGAGTVPPGVVDQGFAEGVVHPAALANSLGASGTVPPVAPQKAAPPVSAPPALPSPAPLEAPAAPLPRLDWRNGHASEKFQASELSEPAWLAPLLGEVAALRQELWEGRRPREASSTGSAAAPTPGVVDRGVAERAVHRNAALAEPSRARDVQQDSLPVSADGLGVPKTPPLATSVEATPVIEPPAPSSMAPSPVGSHRPSLDTHDRHDELTHAAASQHVSEPVWLGSLMGEVAVLRRGHKKLQRAQLDIHEGQQQLILELRQAVSMTSGAATLTPGVVSHGAAALAVHRSAVFADQTCAVDVQQEAPPASSDGLGVSKTAPLVTPSKAALPVVEPTELLSMASPPVASHLPSLDPQDKHELKHALPTQQVSEPLCLAPLAGEVAAAFRTGQEEMRQQLMQCQQLLATQIQHLASQLCQAGSEDKSELS